MIDTTWYSVRQLWDQRNGRVYGVDSSTRAQLQKERTHRELRALYTLRKDMRHCNRDIFYATAAEHLEAQPMWVLKNWLQIQTPMVKFSIKEAERLAVSNPGWCELGRKGSPSAAAATAWTGGHWR